MQNLKIRENENKGFSLVELIVVIAIMAVLTSVLAPSLLAYVERSRAQKDDSAMSEVTNAIILGLSDQDIYDEVLTYTATNASCYVDSSVSTFTLTPAAADVIVFKGGTETVEGASSETVTSGSYFMYTDDHRTVDEKVYAAAGLMRGVTITFKPSDSTVTIADGVLNGFIRTGDGEAANTLTGATGWGTYMTFASAPSYSTTGTLSTGMPNLYYRLRASVGEVVELSSQTYRNSEYTVFVRMGSQGGTDESAQDAVTAHGQWGGTNLQANQAYKK